MDTLWIIMRAHYMLHVLPLIDWLLQIVNANAEKILDHQVGEPNSSVMQVRNLAMLWLLCCNNLLIGAQAPVCISWVLTDTVSTTQSCCWIWAHIDSSRLYHSNSYRHCIDIFINIKRIFLGTSRPELPAPYCRQASMTTVLHRSTDHVMLSEAI